MDQGGRARSHPVRVAVHREEGEHAHGHDGRAEATATTFEPAACAGPAAQAEPAGWLHYREFFPLLLAGLGLALGFVLERTGVGGIAADAAYAFGIFAGLSDIAPRGLRGAVRHKSLDINFLITLASIGAVLVGQWGEAAVIVFLFSLGESLESLTLARTRRSIEALMAIAPDEARVRQPDGSERDVPVEDVPVGALVVVRPGDRIPLDGVVVAGHSAVNQAPITGESVPVEKAPGDGVFGGTINEQGYLEIQTTKPFAQTTLAKIVHLVEEAQAQKAPSQRFVERFARIYTPIVVVGAVLLAAVPPLFLGAEFLPWFNRALVMLLVACPCALVISTPVSVVAAIGNASRHGVLIKGGAYLEQAGRLGAIAFDKTGTLTYGVPEVARVVPLNGASSAEVLRLAAAVEARSAHPLAEAIVCAAGLAAPTGAHGGHQSAHVAPDGRSPGLGAPPAAAGPPAVERFASVAGKGVQGRVDGRTILAGKPAWLAERGFALESAAASLAGMAAAGQTVVLVGVERDAGEQRLLGAVALADQVRPTAAIAVAALRRADMRRIAMLTGDSMATARGVAAQVGLAADEVRAELLPQQKVEAIREIEAAHGSVAMVGDGVNDAPALAAATVGIAMGAGGSDTALETADIALVGGDLTRLPWVLELSRRAAGTIRANVAFALATKAAVLILGAFGLATLWMAIATDAGASVLVILNGMRLLGRVKPSRLADVQAARRRYALGESGPHAEHAH